MMYKPGDKCYSITDDGVKTHIIEKINFHPLCQMLKIDGKWRCADIYFSCQEDVMEAILRNSANHQGYSSR